MKVEFAEAHRDLVESGQTTKEVSYHNFSNLATPQDDNSFHVETAEALANLASATAADRKTLQEMAAANSALTQQLTTVTATLQQALKELNTLKLSATTPQQENKRRNTE